MKFYLSSFKFGNKKDQLRELAPSDQMVIIPNALDFRPSSDERTMNSLDNKKTRLLELGFSPRVMDLREYFGKTARLRDVIESAGSVFILGGNVFVLRQAMYLSGLDKIIIGQKNNPNFLYSGYSAAGCILATSLEPYSVVGDPDIHPYLQLQDTIWEGLGLVDFAFMPHWQSVHPESAAIERGIRYCEKHGIKYKPVRDGEVLIFS